MTDDRYKQIMADLGMPNSRSLLQALQQVANEIAQEQQATVRRLIAEAVEREREACAALCDLHSRLTWNDDRKAQSRLLAAEIRRGPKTNHGSKA